MRIFRAIKRFCWATAAAVGFLALPAGAAPMARTIAITATYYFSGQYSNTQHLGPEFCDVTVNETASFDSSVTYKPFRLRLESGAHSGAHGSLLPAATGSTWTLRGSYYPSNDCAPNNRRPVDCGGPILLGSGNGGADPVIDAFVGGGAVYFALTFPLRGQPLAAASLGEAESQQPGCGGDTLQPYFGVASLAEPYLNTKAPTTLSALAKLRSGGTLTLPVKVESGDPNYSPATCDGQQGCSATVKVIGRLLLRVTS